MSGSRTFPLWRRYENRGLSRPSANSERKGTLLSRLSSANLSSVVVSLLKRFRSRFHKETTSPLSRPRQEIPRAPQACHAGARRT